MIKDEQSPAPGAGGQTGPLTGPGAAVGPLVVSRANPRYFTLASGSAAERRAVYLTGSHIWNNLHDGLGPGADCAATPEQNDYRAYLEFLKDHSRETVGAGTVTVASAGSIRFNPPVEAAGPAVLYLKIAGR